MKHLETVSRLISGRALSVREIAEFGKISHSTVRGALRALRKAGCLKVVRVYRVGVNGRFYPTYAYRLEG